MKNVTIEKTDTTFFIPAIDLLAIWNATSKEDTRHYLNGVFIEHSLHDGVMRMVATDGHVLMSTTLPEPAFMGGGCATQSSAYEEGFILQTDITEKAFKAKPQGDLWIYGDVETGILQFVVYEKDDYEKDVELRRVGVCDFSRIEGDFPDWRRVASVVEKKGETVSFNPDLLDKFNKARKIYGGKHAGALRFRLGGDDRPLGVDLSCNPRFSGVVVSMRFK